MSSSGYSFHYHFFAFTLSTGILCSVVSGVRMDELNALENRGCELFSVYNFITDWVWEPYFLLEEDNQN